MICLSCPGSTIEADLELIKNNLDYIDMAEIRADFLLPDQMPLLRDFPEQAGLPCILTYRWPKDGGRENEAVGAAGGPEGLNPSAIESRCRIIHEALSGGWAFIDLEEDADAECELQLVKSAEAAGTRVIISFHDFTGVPDNLAQRMIDNSRGDRFIPKAAVMPQSSNDLLKLVDVYKRLEEVKHTSQGYSCTNGPLLSDYILVGMGPIGFPSRIMAGAWGSMLTFCSAGSVSAAPGHIRPRDLVEIYNYRHLNAGTKVFGIIGRPVMHTKSPEIHNAAIRKHGIDAVYLPFETPDPEMLLENAGKLNLHGLSVTIPYKQRVISAADSVDESVDAIGACNTLVFQNGWRGSNTDWLGFLAPLEKILSGKTPVKGCSALVIGAGGAARAVVYALASRGADVTVANRTVEKAEALAADFGCRGTGLDALTEERRAERSPYRIVVQTTSAGMEPDIDGNPVPGFDFRGVEIAYDLIYAPEKTVFLKQAEAAGCIVMNGFPMLKAQADEQFRLFTGFTV